ncbi:ribosome maturation factor RimP [Sedimentibacter sp. zth1]|uniref:ribosome maturation factor RimP n=1 Tax=Sedimentibacter sp. zth1 TaxID=2816908 RepID=UPI001A918141|nr:ribosome maturation factor RimP [Sedimentibacter sp. zth1]QSX06549.1 ribosome maturation factor RimP [Sedimentibacter sp. zth1]
MNKKLIIQTATDIINEIIKDTEYQLIDIEYVKEGPFMYLRIYIDKDGGINIDDCSMISNAFNKKIDTMDFIDEQYYLEVSSPGIDRPFKKESDFIDNINNEVEIKLYKNVNGTKFIIGTLLEKAEETVTVQVGKEKVIIELKNISKINKAVEFF